MKTTHWLLVLGLVAAVSGGCDGNGDATDGAEVASSPEAGDGDPTPASAGAAAKISGAGGTPGSCRTSDDCEKEGGWCFAPGTVPMCGTCFVPEYPCGTDADCTGLGSDQICGIQGCFCEPGCIAGCTSSSECDVGETCDGYHHCSPTACGSDLDCPANFECGSGGCARRACYTDKQCAGFCVLDQCWESLGECAMLPL